MRSRTARTVFAGAIISGVLAASLFTSSHTALGSAAGKQHARDHTHALTKVHFILNWVPNVEFAGLWAAQRFNWFKKAGIDMSFTPWSQSVKPETDVASQGGNTFGFQSGAAIAIAKAQGVPIVATYADTQRSVFGLTVLNRSH